MDYAIGALFMLPFYVTASRLYGQYFKRGKFVDSEQLAQAYTFIIRTRK